MKKHRLLCLFLCLIMCLAVPVEAAAGDSSVTAGCHSVDAALPLADSGQLTDTAKAAIVYELSSDTMVYSWNPDEKIYPSSMVKLMTALVALEKGDLEEKVAVTKRALNLMQAGSVSAGLMAGEEMKLLDLLYCLMVASANDAALVIAEHIGGNQDIFITMMNEKAAQLGCTGTRYSNAHGLHDEETYTTARDICRIMEYALENDTFRALFTAESYTVPATNKSEERKIWTTNYMRTTHGNRTYYDARVTGGKTGSTDEAGRCLVATAESGNMALLTIVMGAKPVYSADGLSVERFGSFEETRELLDYTFENYERRQIFFPGQILTQLPVEQGANSVAAGAQVSAFTILPKKLETEQLVWRYGTSGGVTAPVELGQTLSTVQAWFGNKCLAQTDLVAMNAVGVYRPEEPVEKPDKVDGTAIWLTILILVGAVVALALLSLGVLYAIRIVRKVTIDMRRRRRRKNRRRSR